MRIPFPPFIVALTCCWLAACAAPAARTMEYLDEISAATVAAVGEPLVFARPRPEHAAHARDYVRLVAVDVNRAGRHDQWVLAYLPSTLDPRFVSGPPIRSPDTLLVRADDRDIPLVRATSSPEEVGIARRLHAPKGFRGGAIVYRVDAGALAFIADAKHLALRLDASDSEAFEVWADGRASLAEFVQSSGGKR